MNRNVFLHADGGQYFSPAA